MEMTFEFFRTRQHDDAHALLGRVTLEAAGLEAAMTVARSLLADLPQRPDEARITDAEGKELFCGPLDLTTDE